MSSTTLKANKSVPVERRPKSLLREYGESLAIAFILAVIIKFFLFQAFSIPSGSMLNTLQIGDYLLVNKFIYGIRNPFNNKVMIPVGQPHRGDVAVFIFPKDPTKDYIKRVIGLPEDRVQVINKKVYINGKLYVTPQAHYEDNFIIPAPQNPVESARDNFGPVEVPPDSYFCMGDNRDRSYDSRFWGFVPMNNFRGKAMVIYFSWEGPHRGKSQEGESQDYFLPCLLGGLKGLVTHGVWNSKEFQVRWDRIGKIVH